MPSPIATRSSNIAFTPASAIPAPAAPPAAPAPAADAPAGNIAFNRASAPVDIDALLDGFDGPAMAASSLPTSSAAEPEKLDRPVLLFNSQCETCKVLSDWVKRKDASGKDLIDERPIPTTPEALAALNPALDIWKVHEEIHLLMPDGTIKTGGDAIAEVLKALPGTGWYTWALDVSLFGFKPGMKVLDAAYKILDAIRPALGCSSCGGGPVAWWAKPIKWAADAVKWITGNDKPAHETARA